MGTIFSTDDIRGRVDDTLTTDYVWTAGKALAEWLPEQGDIVVMRSEAANAAMVHAFTEGVLLQGRTVIEGGQGDSRLLRSIIRDTSAAGGAAISHDSLQNLEIITLLDSQGVTLTTETGRAEIEQLIEAGNFVPASEKGLVVKRAEN